MAKNKQIGSNNFLQNAGIVVFLCPDYIPHSGLAPKIQKTLGKKMAVFRQNSRCRNNGKFGVPKGGDPKGDIFCRKFFMFSECLKTVVNVIKCNKNVNGVKKLV